VKFILTPVENVDGLWFKREDKFIPFGKDSVNGGKLRQCFALVDAIKDGFDGVISFCSIHSPQAPITSAVANFYGLKCKIYYGGTTKETLSKCDMATIAKEYGAEINIVAKTGRHNVLLNKAKEYAEKNNYFVVEYGFNIVKYPKLLLDAIANQVENIPNELDNLIITCGSGITTTGILIGLKKFNKKVNKIYLVDTAPNRKEKIMKNLEKYDIDINDFNIEVIDIFNRRNFSYEKEIKVVYKGIDMHPQYEAKAFSWLYHESGIDIHNNRNLFWIIGSKPKLRKRRCLKGQ